MQNKTRLATIPPDTTLRQISPTALKLYLVFIASADRSQLAAITLEELALRSAFSRRTVCRALNELRTLGLIVRSGAASAGHTHIPTYRLPHHTVGINTFMQDVTSLIRDLTQAASQHHLQSQEGVTTGVPNMHHRASDGTPGEDATLVSNSETALEGQTK